MDEKTFVDRMSNYMPRPACQLAYSWLSEFPAKIKISKPRRSKLGDFRINRPGTIPVITVNGNLNPYSFTITFTHEIAHLMDHAKRGTLRNPHGSSWKEVYATLLRQLLDFHVFPDELIVVIQNHINSPKAASCSDPVLMDTLRAYDEEATLTLNEIPDGSQFRLANDRLFEKGLLRRTRYKCKELSSGRIFLVHGQAEVELVNP